MVKKKPLTPEQMQLFDKMGQNYKNSDRENKTKLIDSIHDQMPNVSRSFIKRNIRKRIQAEKIPVDASLLSKFPNAQIDYKGIKFNFHSENTYLNGQFVKNYRCALCGSMLTIKFHGGSQYSVVEHEHDHSLIPQKVKSINHKDIEKSQIMCNIKDWAVGNRITSKIDIQLKLLKACEGKNVTIHDTDIIQIVKDVKKTIPKNTNELIHVQEFHEKKWVRSYSQGDFELLCLCYEECERISQRSKYLFVDATFKIAPSNYCQCLNFTVLDSVTNRYIPICHIFMKKKSSSYYNAAFAEVSKFINFRHFEICMCDFEYALITTAINFVGPNKVRGCLFHYRQALYKKYKELKKTNNSKQLDIVLKIFSSLPFTSKNQFDSILDFLNANCNEFKEFMKYYNVQWKKHYTLIQKFSGANPVFTNDGLESYHAKLNNNIKNAHPKVSEAIKILGELDDNILTLNKNDINSGKFINRQIGWRETIQYINMELQQLYNDIGKNGPIIHLSSKQHAEDMHRLSDYDTVVVKPISIEDGDCYENKVDEQDLSKSLLVDFNEDDTNSENNTQRP